MKIEDAKKIVESFKNKNLHHILNSNNASDLQLAISLTCNAANCDDESANLLLKYIPNELSFLGLYPNVMPTFNIKPENN